MAKMICLALLSVVAGGYVPLCAQENSTPSPTPPKTFYLVTVGVFPSLEKAVKFINKPGRVNLADKADPDDKFDDVPEMRRHRGFGLDLHKNKIGNFVVSEYMDESFANAQCALRNVKETFPQAKVEKVQVEFQPENSEQPYFIEDVVVLGADKSYPKILEKIKTISRMTGHKCLDLEDPKTVPTPGNDEPDDTSYLPRRDDEGGALSIELSDGYDFLKPGYYLIVGGIKDDDKEADAAVKVYKKFVPDVYWIKSMFYLGCQH